MKTDRRPRWALPRALPPLQQLTPPADLPCFELTYACNGRTFKALARALNTEAAAHEGLIDLAQQCPDFEPEAARLVAALQVR